MKRARARAFALIEGDPDLDAHPELLGAPAAVRTLDRLALPLLSERRLPPCASSPAPRRAPAWPPCPRAPAGLRPGPGGPVLQPGPACPAPGCSTCSPARGPWGSRRSPEGRARRVRRPRPAASPGDPREPRRPAWRSRRVATGGAGRPGFPAMAAGAPYDLVFLDPPYADGPPELERCWRGLAEGGCQPTGAVVLTRGERSSTSVIPVHWADRGGSATATVSLTRVSRRCEWALPPCVRGRSTP